MYVIRRPSRFYRNATQAADASTEIFVKAGPPLGSDVRKAILRREHDMVVKTSVSGRHPWILAPLRGATKQ